MDSKIVQERTGRARIVALLLALVAASLVLASCDVLGSIFGTSIDSRIASFNAEVAAAQYDQLYTNFSSTGTTSYSDIKSATYWDNTPFAAGDGPGTIVILDKTDPTNVTGTYNSTAQNFTVVLGMVQSGNNWLIQTLTMTPVGGGTAFEIKRLK